MVFSILPHHSFSCILVDLKKLDLFLIFYKFGNVMVFGVDLYIFVTFWTTIFLELSLIFVRFISILSERHLCSLSGLKLKTSLFITYIKMWNFTVILQYMLIWSEYNEIITNKMHIFLNKDKIPNMLMYLLWMIKLALIV